MKLLRPFLLLSFLVVLCGLIIPSSSPLRGQSPSAQRDRPTFDVTSVKPIPTGDLNFRFGFQTGGRFVSNSPLQAVISFAYNLPFNPGPRLTGGPDWIR